MISSKFCIPSGTNFSCFFSITFAIFYYLQTFLPLCSLLAAILYQPLGEGVLLSAETDTHLN